MYNSSKKYANGPILVINLDSAATESILNDECPEFTNKLLSKAIKILHY